MIICFSHVVSPDFSLRYECNFSWQHWRSCVPSQSIADHYHHHGFPVTEISDAVRCCEKVGLRGDALELEAHFLWNSWVKKNGVNSFIMKWCCTCFENPADFACCLFWSGAASPSLSRNSYYWRIISKFSCKSLSSVLGLDWKPSCVDGYFSWQYRNICNNRHVIFIENQI